MIDDGDVADFFEALRQDAGETLAHGMDGEVTGILQGESFEDFVVLNTHRH